MRLDIPRAVKDSRTMEPEELRRQLASLVVNALELGTSKREPILDDLFAAFGAEVPSVQPGIAAAQIMQLRESATTVLVEAAPSAAALLNELLRCGGDFLAMVDEVYAHLAKHVSTTSGTSEAFRLQRDEFSADMITLSPAFLEELHSLQRQLQSIRVGRLQEDLIAKLVMCDGGELYGRWPLGDPDGRRLLDEVLHLAWLPRVATPRVGAVDAVRTALEQARAAAEALVAAAAQLVGAHMAHLDQVSGMPAVNAAPLLFSNPLDDQRRLDRLLNRLEAELAHFSEERLLGVIAGPGTVAGLDHTALVALDPDTEPVVLATDTFWGGTGVSALAGFVALWRRGLYATRTRKQLERSHVLDDAGVLASWLDELRASCEDATRWLTDEAFGETGRADSSVVVETVTQFLNLPLWRHRDLLYEVWVLCVTLDAAEAACWVSELSGLTETNDVWVLSLRPTSSPVARLSHADDPAVTLNVWREPSRAMTQGVLTPDVSVSTPGPSPLDLLVVEAKDRVRMISGVTEKSVRRPGTFKRGSALGVAQKYVVGLRPRVTWVCNHSDFDTESDPATNHGDVWSRIHLAARFRPKNVPPEFTSSVRVALAPPGDLASPHPEPGAAADAERRALTLVVDVTRSMVEILPRAYDALRSAREFAESFAECRAVVYSDHGVGEPFLLRKLGPVPHLGALADGLEAQPSGHGGDEEEALEDAMQRCRELVADVGPHTFLVLTDAPPHAQRACPYGIAFDEEVGALLDAGCTVSVADDWQWRGTSAWAPFEGRSGFVRAPLRELLTVLGAPVQ
jgi:hypothetical protein